MALTISMIMSAGRDESHSLTRYPGIDLLAPCFKLFSGFPRPRGRAQILPPQPHLLSPFLDPWGGGSSLCLSNLISQDSPHFLGDHDPATPRAGLPQCPSCFRSQSDPNRQFSISITAFPSPPAPFCTPPSKCLLPGVTPQCIATLSDAGPRPPVQSWNSVESGEQQGFVE